ncbi:hypothetical protein VSH64_03255 [Amycolatopsis rhabdoformis]|uniref:Uncharacterized protein n=1 Tax=Amycolatopsis rhabdoformis TaxID=1448059 RepID=A0ABZ1IBM6_9PSEU|nr:hypothetical protein [Amycolatopsis rhabdoformis]WSE31136.1 hypothetical protein VSH64_03255 [Amycolatopsis rhabdoformis]
MIAASAVVASAGLLGSLATTPAATAAEASSGWTTITDDAGQTFSYNDGVQANSINSGTFTFTADFNARLESRHYTTPNFGTHRVFLGPAAHCTRGETITVELWAEAFPGDANLGSRNLSCASGGTAVFDNISPDTFYFVLTAGSFGVTPNRTLSGDVTYP